MLHFGFAAISGHGGMSRSMSALPPKADIRRGDWDVRFVPLTDMSSLRNGPYFVA
jgi:hypothetical protein